MNFKSLFTRKKAKESMSEEDSHDPAREKRREIHDIIKSLKIEQHQKQEFHIRVEQLPLEELDDYKLQMEEKAGTSREQSEAISEGEAEEHYIGKHTSETLQQELFSLMNTKPAFRDRYWNQKFDDIQKEIEQIQNPRVKRRLRDKARAMLDGEG